jgi:hypothetical protein
MRDVEDKLYSVVPSGQSETAHARFQARHVAALAAFASTTEEWVNPPRDFRGLQVEPAHGGEPVMRVLCYLVKAKARELAARWEALASREVN